MASTLVVAVGTGSGEKLVSLEGVLGSALARLGDLPDVRRLGLSLTSVH